MKVKFVEDNPTVLTFKDLSKGDLFHVVGRHDKSVFMRTDIESYPAIWIYDGGNYQYKNDGTLCIFEPFEKVTRFHGTLVEDTE